ncbi:NCS1 nucleoside transporter family, partial [Aureobasidium pullulans]
MPSLLQKIEVEHDNGLSNKELFLTNHDLKIVEPERRQWTAFNFVGFWIADSFNINTWMIAASSLDVGLSWWQAWICVWVGYSISAFFICLTGRVGAVYHISFPVMNRSSFGIYGSLWPVLNRALMACIWYGVQGWIGGECVYLMILAIWPSFGSRPSLTKEIALGGTVNYLIGFILFWAGSLPFIWFPVHKVRHLFTVKAVVAPTAGIAFLVWALVRAGGAGKIIHQPAKAKGSELAWAIITGIMSSVSNFATLIVNDPDFSRFASKPSDALLPQFVTIPLGFGLTSLIGILVGSASAVIYPELGAVWNPLQLLNAFITEDGHGSAGARAGVFLIAAAFVVAQLGTNIAANSISAGTDLTALLPRYINIRRGGYICAVIGIAICPWQFVAGSSTFTTYLSAYSVFLSAIAGPMIIDYYCVRKGYLQARDLYSADVNGPYYGRFGIQWRGYVAYICGILINVVGFAGACGASVPIGATYIYRLNFFTGFIVSGGVYWILCSISPVKAQNPVGSWLEAPEPDEEDLSNVVSHGKEVEQYTSGVDVEQGGFFRKKNIPLKAEWT